MVNLVAAAIFLFLARSSSICVYDMCVYVCNVRVNSCDMLPRNKTNKTDLFSLLVKLIELVKVFLFIVLSFVGL